MMAKWLTLLPVLSAWMLAVTSGYAQTTLQGTVQQNEGSVYSPSLDPRTEKPEIMPTTSQGRCNPPNPSWTLYRQVGNTCYYLAPNSVRPGAVLVPLDQMRNYRSCVADWFNNTVGVCWDALQGQPAYANPPSPLPGGVYQNERQSSTGTSPHGYPDPQALPIPSQTLTPQRPVPAPPKPQPQPLNGQANTFWTKFPQGRMAGGINDRSHDNQLIWVAVDNSHQSGNRITGLLENLPPNPYWIGVEGTVYREPNNGRSSFNVTALIDRDCKTHAVNLRIPLSPYSSYSGSSASAASPWPCPPTGSMPRPARGSMLQLRRGSLLSDPRLLK